MKLQRNCEIRQKQQDGVKTRLSSCIEEFASVELKRPGIPVRRFWNGQSSDIGGVRSAIRVPLNEAYRRAVSQPAARALRDRLLTGGMGAMRFPSPTYFLRLTL